MNGRLTSEGSHNLQTSNANKTATSLEGEKTSDRRSTPTSSIRPRPWRNGILDAKKITINAPNASTRAGAAPNALKQKRNETNSQQSERKRRIALCREMRCR